MENTYIPSTNNIAVKNYDKPKKKTFALNGRMECVFCRAANNFTTFKNKNDFQFH